LCKKLDSEGRRPTHINKYLFGKLKQKVKMHRQWKREHTSWEEYKDNGWECRHELRKAKQQIQLQINLARAVPNI